MSTPSELRELDAWIAEHLFGDRPDPSKTIPFASEQYCHPRYTTDPAAAMTVLEKCIVKVGWSRIVGLGSTSDGNYFINHFDPEPESEAFCTNEASTLPLAICRFARNLFEK